MAEGGWAFRSGSTKAHYFTGPGRSLCSQWLLFAAEQLELEPDNGKASSDDCKACRRKLEASNG